jgi:hypothetical protein
MAQTTLIIDDDTAKLIQELRTSFGSTTNSSAIKRAIVLASVAARNASDDMVTILDKNNEKRQIMLKG